jgi:hypothetical protein
MPTTGFEKVEMQKAPAWMKTVSGADIRIEGNLEQGAPVEMIVDADTRIKVGFIRNVRGAYGSIDIEVYPQYAHLFGKKAPGIFKEYSVMEPRLDPNPWQSVDARTRAATRRGTPDRHSVWRPREGFEQDHRKYPWQALSSPNDSYPVRRAMAAMSVYGYRDHPATFPPVWGYYVAHGSPSSTRKLIDVVETQKALAIRAATYDQRDVRLYDAKRAFYEYTDPFGAKTYA